MSRLARKMSRRDATPLLRQAERLHASGKMRDAIPLYQQALKRNPRNPEVWYSTGVCLIACGDYEGGTKFLEAALIYDPDSITGLYNCGMAYDAMGKLEQAKEKYLEAIRLNPQFILAHVNIGSIYYRQGDPEKGHWHHSQALAIEPADDEEKAGRALVRLVRDNSSVIGWGEYECRWKLAQTIEKNPGPESGVRWSGEAFGGQPLLVWHEQGIGDSLMMFRYLDSLPKDSFVMVQPSLKRLAEWCFPQHRIIERGEPCEYHWHVPMMSLPGILNCIESPPYLEPNPALAPTLPEYKGLTVGIQWGGSKGHMNNKDRSCPFSEFKRLFQVQGVRWVSLQTPAEPNTLETITGADIYEIPLDDFAETAAVIDQCDLVICIDSAVGHLAGAMGKPTWLLPPTAPEFRWGLEGETTRWYPKHKLYRRAHTNDWTNVIERVANDLTEIANGR